MTMEECCLLKAHVVVGGGYFLACEDFEGKFDQQFKPFFSVEISSRGQTPVFRVIDQSTVAK